MHEQGALIDIDRAFQQLFHGLRMLSFVFSVFHVGQLFHDQKHPRTVGFPMIISTRYHMDRAFVSIHS